MLWSVIGQAVQLVTSSTVEVDAALMKVHPMNTQ